MGGTPPVRYLPCVVPCKLYFTGIYTVCIYIGGRPVVGWTTTMLFLSFAFLGLFVILTIIIKYMSLILKINFNKQKYIIESIEKITN